MSKFMVTHTVPPGAFTREQVCGVADALQHDEHVKGYRSFMNLSEGKIMCVLEADSAEAIAAWFKEHELPFDNITLVEYEGDHGEIHDALPAGATA